MRKKKLFLVIIFVVTSCVVVRRYGFVDVATVDTIFSCMAYPLLYIQSSVVEPLTTWWSRSVTVKELEKAYEHLQHEYDIIFAENVSLKSARWYSDATQELRDFNNRYLLKKGHIVHVLARHFSSNNQFFLVNAGSRQGIKKDMVALYGNCLVGRVTDVYPWYCKIYLITGSECKVAAFCPETGASGIHEGFNDAINTTLRYVSHLAKITHGSILLSSGEGLVFPYGFAVGKIVAVDQGELFYDIKVQPILDFQSLHYCVLVAKEDIENIVPNEKG